MKDEQQSAGHESKRRRLQHVMYHYEDCPLKQAESLDAERPVRMPCETQVETLLQEGRPPDEWVWLRTSRDYDGYAQVRRETNHGVVGMGEHGDAPCSSCDAPSGTVSGACGPQCLGDEFVTETESIEPGPGGHDSWTLGLPYRSLTYTQEAGPRAETLSFYDGMPFVGKSLGRFDRGLLTRVCQRKSPNAAPDCQGKGWRESLRVEHDSHGNVVTELDPLATLDNGRPALRGHVRSFEYDAYHLKLAAVRLHLVQDQTSYRLRRSLAYEDTFYQPSAVSRWTLEGAGHDSDPAPTRFKYDAFGRRSMRILPGDSEEAPSQRFEYEIGDPVSRIVVRERSEVGGPFDLEQVQCVDGLGRTVQTRTRLEGGRYQVTGFHEVNPQGAPVHSYQPYVGGADCDQSAPAEVAFQQNRYDALGRPIEQREPDAALYQGRASTTRTVYGPLYVATYDPEDNDPDSPAYDTPSHLRQDGLGRTVRLERLLVRGGEPNTVRALWDALGNLAGTLDPGGYYKQQASDLLGRVTEVDDPNAGSIQLRYDDANNLVASTDARGRTVLTEYDGANRQVARYEQGNREASLQMRLYDFAPNCNDCRHAEGQLVQQRYPLDQTRGGDDFGYDLRAQQTHFARNLHGQRFVLRHRYDQAGRLQKTTFPDGTELALRFDGASRVAAVGGVLKAVHYAAHGLPSELLYQNDTRTRSSYDARLRLQSLRILDAQNAPLQATNLTRDRVSNLDALEDLADRREGGIAWQQRLQHDAWYRTTQLNLTDSQETLDFTFDNLDNVTKKVSSLGERGPAHVGRYQYAPDKPNALTSAGTLDYGYDEAGHVQKLAGTLLAWDAQGRLESAQGVEGQASAYYYSQGVERVFEQHGASRTYFVGPDFEIHDGVAFTYARLGGSRVARLTRTTLGPALLGDPSQDGRVDVADAWLDRQDAAQAAAQLRGVARRLLADAEDDGPIFFYHDALGSLTLATDVHGKLRGERAFYPTGQVRAEQGFVDRYGFTGQRLDPTTGLTHFRFRELDARTARWVSPDPLFAVASPQGLARAGESTTAYAYVAGNFASSYDKHGLAGAHTAPRNGGTTLRRVPSRTHAHRPAAAPDGGYHMAMGLKETAPNAGDNLLENFSREMGAYSYFNAPVGIRKHSQSTNFRRRMGENVIHMMENAQSIRFNVRGIDFEKVRAFRDVLASLGTLDETTTPPPDKFTEWELVQLMRRKDTLLSKTTFYDFDATLGRYTEWQFPF